MFGYALTAEMPNIPKPNVYRLNIFFAANKFPLCIIEIENETNLKVNIEETMTKN